MKTLSKRVDHSPLTMESFKIRVVSKASAQLFPDNTLSTFPNFLPQQFNLDGQYDVKFSQKTYPSLYQIVTMGKFMFYDKKLPNSFGFYYLEPDFYPPITDNVEAMNTLIDEKHNHSENCITVETSQKTRKVDIYPKNEGSGLAFFSLDLRHSFGSKIGNEREVMLRGRGPHKPKYAFDFVRIHSLVINMDLIEYNIAGNTQVSLLRCFLFLSNLIAGDIVTTGQYMKYQTFSHLQFRPLLENYFHSIHIELKDLSCEKIPFVPDATTSMGRENLKKNWVVVAEKRVPVDSVQQNLQNKPVGHRETFLQTFLNNLGEYFWVPTSCGSFWKTWREGPSS